LCSNKVADCISRIAKLPVELGEQLKMYYERFILQYSVSLPAWKQWNESGPAATGYCKKQALFS
jgi:hypothetical protein